TLSNDTTQLIRYLQRRFAGAELYSVYEAGFSGFGLHRALCRAGIQNLIQNLVVHAAAVEIAARDRVKTDKRDSRKLAVQLAAGVCEIAWCFGQIGRDDMVTIGAMATASSCGFPELGAEHVLRHHRGRIAPRGTRPSTGPEEIA